MNSPLPRSRLGRGLASLIGEGPQPAQARIPAEGEQRTLPVAQLRSSRFNPRKDFGEQDLAELAESIRTKGLVQPIVVRPHPEDPQAFEIVAGERRWRAAQKAQLHEVPVVIRELTEEEAAEIALIENVQRVDLNAIEEARAYQRLIEVYKRTPDEIAKAVGKSRSHIANSLRLLTVAPALFEAVEKGTVTAGHARALIGAPDQQRLLSIVLAKNLSVRDTEALVRGAHEQAAARSGKAARPAPGGLSRPGKLKPPAPFPSSPGKKDADTRALEEAIAASLGMFVTIEHKPRGDGMVGIGYRDLDQLDEIVRRLTGSRV